MGDIPCLLKRSHIIPPVAALLVVTCWNLSRWRAVSVEASETEVLRGKIRAAGGGMMQDGEGGEGHHGAASKPQKNGTSQSGSHATDDWTRIAERLLAMQNSDGISDLREALEIQQKISNMSRDEIIAALDEISGLDLKSEARALLEETLVGPLVELDPEYALKTFASRIPRDDDGIGWQLSAALEMWAGKDVQSASAWFDQQIAAGLFDSKTLDGRSQTRIEFEAAMTGALLTQDPQRAGRRISELPEDQRREALEQIDFTGLSPSAQAAYASLVRQLVPEDERAGSFSHVVSQLVPEGGYEKVAGFLDQIRATPDEREVSAKEAANARIGEISGDRIVTREDVDAMRKWLEQQAPGSADTVTGEALANAAQDGGEFGFDDASKLALDYHKSTGNDEVLVAFLESYAARSNLDEALPLAENIKDPNVREKVLARLK